MYDFSLHACGTSIYPHASQFFDLDISEDLVNYTAATFSYG